MARPADDLDFRMLGALGAQRSLGQGGTQRPDLSGRPVGAPRPASPDPRLGQAVALVQKLRAGLAQTLQQNQALQQEVDRLKAQLAQAQGAAQAAWRGRAARGEQPPVPAEVEQDEGLSAAEVLGGDFMDDDDGMGA
jgi:hypothetical protein